MKELHILNLGAGVQSTALYLMDLRGELGSPRFDYAIFADTQDEPAEVYAHLDWLGTLDGAPIIRGTAGRLGDDLVRTVRDTPSRFASIPAFTTEAEGVQGGMTRRQCTREYKIEVIGKVIRRKILGLSPGQRTPKDVHIHQYFGLSFDESGRVARVMGQYRLLKGVTAHFPLYADEITRRGCLAYLERVIPGRPVARSACVFCPYKTNAEWRRLRDNDAAGWDRACEVDERMREADAIRNTGFDQKLYVHRSCKPLRSAPIDTPESRGEQPVFGFAQECEGMCGI